MAEDIDIILRYILFATPQAILILASYKYLKKGKGKGAGLLFAGSLIVFLSFTFGWFFNYLVGYDTLDSFNYGLISGTNRIVNIAGSFLFAFGFLAFVRDFIKKHKPSQDEVDQIGKG